jgi:hypothetical protein
MEAYDPIVIHISVLDTIYNFYAGRNKNRWYATVSLYTFLYTTARKQKTQRVWATDEFIHKGTGLSRRVITEAKNDLKRIGLIDIHKERDKDGRIKKTYIELRLIWKSETIKKLFYQEQDESTEYKIARNLLLNNFGEEYRFKTEYSYSFYIEMNGFDVDMETDVFFFRDELLMCEALIKDSDVEEVIVPTSLVEEIIKDIVSMYSYKIGAVYASLVEKVD